MRLVSEDRRRDCALDASNRARCEDIQYVNLLANACQLSSSLKSLSLCRVCSQMSKSDHLALLRSSRRGYRQFTQLLASPSSHCLFHSGLATITHPQRPPTNPGISNPLPNSLSHIPLPSLLVDQFFRYAIQFLLYSLRKRMVLSILGTAGF